MMQPKTDQEWADYLNKEVGDCYADTEARHHTADFILIKFVRAAGYLKLAEAWDAVDKWYA